MKAFIVLILLSSTKTWKVMAVRALVD